MQEVFLLSLGAAVFFALTATLDKFLLENKMPNPVSYFLLQTFLAIVFFTFLSTLLFGFEVPSINSLWLLLFSAITANIGFFIYFSIVKNYNLSSVGPLLQTKLLFTIPLAFVFLGEFYGLGALALMVLIFMGAILTTYSQGLSPKALLFNNRLLLLALLMTLSWAFADLPVKVVTEEISAASFVAWRYIFSVPVIGLFALVLFKGDNKKDLFNNLRATIPLSIVATLVSFTGIVLLFMAYAFSYTIPSAIILSEAIFVFAIAFIASRIKSGLLREKQPLKVYLVRFAGVLLIVSSVYFLISSNIVL